MVISAPASFITLTSSLGFYIFTVTTSDDGGGGHHRDMGQKAALGVGALTESC